jgi:hypothetical protein
MHACALDKITGAEVDRLSKQIRNNYIKILIIKGNCILRERQENLVKEGFGTTGGQHWIRLKLPRTRVHWLH